MGTKVQIESYLPGHCSMRDLGCESNGATWQSYYGDNNLSNGPFYYSFPPRTIADSQPGYDKDVVKQTMLEHEAIFKNQVYELHRLYQVQRDLMDEIRRKEQFKHRIPYETSSSSSPVPSHMQYEDAQRWNGPSLPLANSVCGRPPFLGPDTVQSSPHSAKGKSIQAATSLSEVSESRPTKFRRRMFDLQLPADEYVDPDEVEQFGNVKVFDNTSPLPDKNVNIASGNGKLFPNYHGRIECHGDASRPNSHVSKLKALADLNEPLHVEETTTVSSLEFLGGASAHRDNHCRDLSTNFLSTSRDILQNSRHGGLIDNLNNLPFENKSNCQDWFCYASESERLQNDVRSITKGTPSIPSQPMQSFLDQVSQPPSLLTCDRIKGDQWGANSVGNMEKSDRSHSILSYNTPEPILSSHVPNQSGLFNPSDLVKSWDKCASNWGKPSGCLSQKLSAQTTPFLSSAPLSRCPQSSAQSNDFFGNKWNVSPGSNGFYQGLSASLKEPPVRFPPVAFDYVNCNYSGKTVPCSSNSYLKTATCVDVKPVKDMNLNVPLPDVLSDDHFNQPDSKIIDKDHKSEDPLAVLPWLKGKDTSFVSSSYDGDVKSKKPESSGCLSSRKILGVPIFESPSAPKEENTAVITPPSIHNQPRNEAVKNSDRRCGFDINIPCELVDSEPDSMAVEVVVVEKKTQNEAACLRNNFDLNSGITEEESPCRTSLPDNSASIKGGTGIDLEAPVMLESEDDVAEEDPLNKEQEKQLVLPPDIANVGEAELAKSAAEAIVAISSSVNQNQSEAEEAICLPMEEASQEELLHWFVEVVCSTENEGEHGDHLPEGLDDFESLTLRQKECNFEEYFPKPSIPDIPNIEENGPCKLTTRTRKGHARRGRQRRDFQRDILPGLTSLSRHEVTEDLQTFGGLMRATGHPWHSGPNRRNATRNGCGRGRRRAVAAAPVKQQQQQQQQLPSSNTEVVLEDRSLTGWGKTTRRPRRQRCHAGNPCPPVPLN